MPQLLADFAKLPNARRQTLDVLQSQFLTFMEGRGERQLTTSERKAGLGILGRARKTSRKYYENFRDYAWKNLREDPQLAEAVSAEGSGAKWGKSRKSALRIQVRVTRPDGTRLPPTYRSVDFEHLTRVTDQPFKRHSDEGGKQRNLTPMLGDLNRYYNEALRNVTGAHMFTNDAIEQFIVMHQLYDKGSPALRDLEFRPVGGS